MAWRDMLLPATLDGVPFLFHEVDSKIGRRGEVHEFPGRDEPFAEDLGRMARRWSIRAFVLGPNYHVERDDLAEVVESGRDLQFQHPYKGSYTVKVIGEVTIKETDEEGGMASFDLQLVESGLAFPLLAVATPSRVKALSANALGKLSTKTRFSLLKAIAAVLKSVARGLQAASSAVRKVNGKIAAALNLVDNITAAIDDFNSEIGTLLGAPQALMNKLSNLVRAAFDLINRFSPAATVPGVRVTMPDLPKLAMANLRDAFKFRSDPDAVPTPVPQSVLEHNAHAQLTGTMKAAALASAVEVLVDLNLDSAQQAEAISGELSGMFDDVLAVDFDPDVHEAFAALKAATVQHLTDTARRLPEINDYTPPATVPALVLAYELYGDADRDDEIIRRNRIRHPSFVVGGRPLEVIAGG